MTTVTKTSTTASETFNLSKPIDSTDTIHADVVFAPGFGQDTISLNSTFVDTSSKSTFWNPSIDSYTIKLGPGISPSDVQVRVLDDVNQPGGFRFAPYTVSSWQLVVKSTGDTITIADPQAPELTRHDAPRVLTQVEFADGTVWTPADVAAQWRLASNAAYSVYGSSGDDLLLGNADAHALVGGAGNDTLVSGLGSELFQPGGGNNVIRLGLSSGFDTLVGDTVAAGASMPSNILEFTDAAQTTSLFTSRSDEYDLLLSGIVGGGRILVSNFFKTGVQVLDAVKFADGTMFNRDELAALAARGSSEGIRRFTGTDGNDSVIGSQASNALYGLAGDDTLTGGGGNDVLRGGIGKDTYVFNRGDGQDTILVKASDLTTDANIGGQVSGDTLRFGPGIKREQLTFSRDAQGRSVFGLVDEHGLGTTDQVTFDTPSSLKFQMQFDDGSVLEEAAFFLYEQGFAGFGGTMTGDSSDETFRAYAGNTTISAGAGNDTLISGKRNDVLDGGEGADTYIYARGNGSDTILADNSDTIVLGQDITKADLVVGKLGAVTANSVVLAINNAGAATADLITLDNAGNWAGLQLKFADGSTLSGADILVTATKPDNLTLTGTTKADVLRGKDGNDTLTGLAGNDILAGGKGNDSLIGGKGNDTYLFNRGEGQDVINDADNTLFNSDLLKLGGATSKQLWLTKAGNNLDIKILGTQDKVTVQNWFASSNNRVEKITTSDGKSLSASKVQALVNAMASFTPPADAASLPANAPAALTKLVASSWV